jgi:hypothetical protein
MLLAVGDLTIEGRTNEHLLTATRNGQAVWNFVAGGRIGFRGPIQADNQRIYFGSHDGHIYAANHADGSLAWRVLAAPADTRMVAFGQVESSWPKMALVPVARLAKSFGVQPKVLATSATMGMKSSAVRVNIYYPRVMPGYIGVEP